MTDGDRYYCTYNRDKYALTGKKRYECKSSAIGKYHSLAECTNSCMVAEGDKS